MGYRVLVACGVVCEALLGSISITGTPETILGGALLTLLSLGTSVVIWVSTMMLEPFESERFESADLQHSESW